MYLFEASWNVHRAGDSTVGQTTNDPGIFESQTWKFAQKVASVVMYVEGSETENRLFSSPAARC